MQFTDKLTLDGAIRRTADGYGVVSARVARSGNVQVYLGSEVGMNDKATVRVYRPESEVFKKDAIAWAWELMVQPRPPPLILDLEILTQPEP